MVIINQKVDRSYFRHSLQEGKNFVPTIITVLTHQQLLKRVCVIFPCLFNDKQNEIFLFVFSNMS